MREDDVQALSRLVELVKPYQSDIEILHIYPDSEYKGIEKIEWFKELVKEHIAYERISFEILQ